MHGTEVQFKPIPHKCLLLWTHSSHWQSRLSDATARSHHGLARSTAIDAAVLAVSQQELAGEPLSARAELDLISPESVWSERQAHGGFHSDPSSTLVFGKDTRF